MTIFVLFGQRKEDYPGQFAPEALEVISCYGHEENPEFLEEKLAEYTKTEEKEKAELARLKAKFPDG